MYRMAPVLLSPRDAASALLQRHRHVLASHQPTLDIPELPADATAVWGRDGSPTFRTGETWWTQCSVPRAASKALLEAFRPTSSVACFLFPFHPAAVREALDMTSSQQAVIALLGDIDLSMFLSCEDFSADFASNRLWLVRDAAGLEALLQDRRGLPVPGIFIRTPGTDDALVKTGVDSCQAVFSRIRERNEQHAEQIRRTPRTLSRPAQRLLVATTNRFKLWDDAQVALRDIASAMDGMEMMNWAIDDPASMSPLHLLEQSSKADALLAADFFRGDAHGVLPSDLPVITWVTQPRVDTYTAASKLDRVLLADPAFRKLARQAGWPDAQVEMAARPTTLLPSPPPGSRLALIADTLPLSIPPEIEDFSSHRLLWERAESELRTDPLRIGTDIAGYLDRMRIEMHIAPEGFPTVTIAERLVVPLWQQEVARRILGAGLPLKIYGSGWDKTEVSSAVAGSICSVQDLRKAVEQAAALIVPIPVAYAHPAEACGRAALRASGDLASFLRRAAAAVASPAKPAIPTIPILSTNLLRRLL